MNTYKCDHCDYKTKTKHHYQQHCRTKKHILKVQGKVVERTHYTCQGCNFLTYYKDAYEKHCLTKKHQRTLQGKIKEDEWYCACCDYHTYYKHAYKKHCDSAKHKRKVSAEPCEKQQIPICNFCQKKLKNMESLRRHKERYRKLDVFAKYIDSSKLKSQDRRELEDYFLTHGEETGLDPLQWHRMKQYKRCILEGRIKREKDKQAKTRLEQNLKFVEEKEYVEPELSCDESDESEEEEKDTKADMFKRQRQDEMVPRTLFFKGKEHKMPKFEDIEVTIADIYIDAYKDEPRIQSPKRPQVKVPEYYDVNQDPLFRSHYPRPKSPFACGDWRKERDEQDRQRGVDDSVYGYYGGAKSPKKKPKTVKARKV